MNPFNELKHVISFPAAFDSPPMVFLNVDHTAWATRLIVAVPDKIGAEGFTVVLFTPGNLVVGTFTVNWLAISQ